MWVIFLDLGIGFPVTMDMVFEPQMVHLITTDLTTTIKQK